MNYVDRRSFVRFGVLFLASILLCNAPARSQDTLTGAAVLRGIVITERYIPPGLAVIANETLKKQFERLNRFEVIPWSIVERTAKETGVNPPYRDRDMERIAKAAGAKYLIEGDISSYQIGTKGGKPAVQVGITLRVHHLEMDDIICSITEKVMTVEPPNRTPGDIATENAVIKAVASVSTYQVITGTILIAPGQSSLVLNRGAGHGLRNGQEFLVYRSGVKVGRVRATKVQNNFTELAPVDSKLGLRAQDTVIAVASDSQAAK